MLDHIIFQTIGLTPIDKIKYHSFCNVTTEEMRNQSFRKSKLHVKVGMPLNASCNEKMVFRQ